MVHTTFNFDFKDLGIDLNRIEKVLGYGDGDDRLIVNSITEQIVNEPELFLNIRAEYKIFDNIEFVASDKSININNISFDTHKIVYGQLIKSDSVAVILSTAGKELGIRTRKAMSEGDPLTGYLYDIVGSIVVDAAADRLQTELEKTVMNDGWKITNRYSPGYCGWDVSEQHKLFRLVPDNFCGIRITESALMDPIKSISGIIGIGESVIYNHYTCSLCDMKECAFREVKKPYL